jgi:hypothetical protein
MKTLAEHGGLGLTAAGECYAKVYVGRREALVIRAVASRQRCYASGILAVVDRWEAEHPAGTLEALADRPADAATYGLLPRNPPRCGRSRGTSSIWLAA